MLPFKRIREYENLHILLWLVKDMCWVMLWHTAGMIMIVPTIAVAVHITWLSRDIKSELFHNLAICMWISANSVWMTGEFFYNDSLRPVAMVFFLAGLVTITFHYIRIFGGKKHQNKSEQF